VKRLTVKRRLLLSPIFLIHLVLFAVTPSASAETGVACSCAQVHGVPEALEQASLVFRGKVLAEKEEFVNGVNYRAALFLVQEVWQGTDATQVIVRTPAGSCPFEWERLNDYLIYAYEKDGVTVTDGCTRSAAIEQADADLQALGAGAVPERIVDLQDEFDENRTVYLIGFFASLAVVIGSVAVMVRRYRRFRQNGG